MTTQVTLAYSATATNATPAALGTDMAAVPLYSSVTSDEVLGRLLGLTVASDTTSVVGQVVTRTIVLDLAAPAAPPFFALQTPNAEERLAVFSTSGADHEITGILFDPVGAHQVTVSYKDSNGASGVATALLLGRTPVVLQLAPGTVDFGGGIIDFFVSLTGSHQVNQGQLTLSIITPPEGGFPPVPLQTTTDAELLTAYQDKMQNLLGPAVAMIPPGYISLDPQYAGSLLTNLYTYTLAKALAVPVTAAAPVFA